MINNYATKIRLILILSIQKWKNIHQTFLYPYKQRLYTPQSLHIFGKLGEWPTQLIYFRPPQKELTLAEANFCQICVKTPPKASISSQNNTIFGSAIRQKCTNPHFWSTKSDENSANGKKPQISPIFAPPKKPPACGTSGPPRAPRSLGPSLVPNTQASKTPIYVNTHIYTL